MNDILTFVELIVVLYVVFTVVKTFSPNSEAGMLSSEGKETLDKGAKITRLGMTRCNQSLDEVIKTLEDELNAQTPKSKSK